MGFLAIVKGRSSYNNSGKSGPSDDKGKLPTTKILLLGKMPSACLKTHEKDKGPLPTGLSKT